MPVASDVASTTDGPNQLSNGNSLGTILGQATTAAGVGDKIAFYGTTPVTQQGAGGSTVTSAAGSTTAVYVNTTFTGGTGTTAYTVGDIVAALKAVGLIAP